MMTFIMHTDWRPLVCSLKDWQKGQVLDALFAHASGEDAPPEDEAAKGIYDFIVSQIDKESEKYETRRKARAEAGRAGGLKKAENAKTESSEEVAESSKDLANSSKDLANSSKSLANSSKPLANPSKSYLNSNSNNNSNSNLRDIRDVCRSKSDPIAEGVAAIPLRNNTEYQVTQKRFDEYCKAYPKVDVRAEFMRMRSWSLDNPSRQKTKQGVSRFINNWLAGEQEKREKSPSGSMPQYKPNQFTSFEQRDYSQEEIDELERRLLSQ